MKKQLEIGVILLLVGVISLALATQVWPALRPGMRVEAGSNQPVVAIDTAHQDTIRYTNYSPLTFNQLANQRRILFFDASWCQTCAGAEKEISANTEKIPANVTVFKVDFDAAKDLRQKYGVTNQHTFIQVDTNGNQITTWNGGGIDELLAKLM